MNITAERVVKANHQYGCHDVNKRSDAQKVGVRAGLIDASLSKTYQKGDDIDGEKREICDVDFVGRLDHFAIALVQALVQTLVYVLVCYLSSFIF